MISVIVCVIGIIISALSAFLIKKRINQINDLPTTILSTLEKEQQVASLNTRLYIALGCIGANVLNFILPDGLLKFMIPVVSVFVIGFIMSSTMEEADEFNVTKDEIDVYMEEQERRKKEADEQKKAMEEERKRRREQKDNQ